MDKLAKQRYNLKIRDALTREIDFLMSFDEWWDIWQKSGYYSDYGCRKGQYCMSRYNDVGPYHKDNVFIQLTTDNTKQGNIGKKFPLKGAKISAALLGKKRPPMSQVTKDKISVIHKDKIVSEETRRKLSESGKAYYARKNGGT